MSRAKDRGTAAETAVAHYLRANGFPHAERRALSGARDRGDIAGVHKVVLEVKAAAKPEYGAWLAEAERERINAAAGIAAVIHQPKGLGPANVNRWRAVLDLETLTLLLRDGPPHG